MTANRNPFAKYHEQNPVNMENNPFAKYHPENSESLLEKAENYAGKFNSAVETSRLPAIAGGILQGGGDIATSLANIPLNLIQKATGKDVTLSHPDLGRFVPNDIVSKSAFGAGEIIPNIIGGIGASNAIGKVGGLTESVSKIPAVGNLVAKPLEGALAGAAIGEDKEGNRGLGAALGAAGNALYSAGKYAHSLLPEGLAKNILSAKSTAQQKYSDLYNGIFQKAQQSGLSQVPLRAPQIDVNLIKSNAAKKYYQSLENFYANPTLENAHLAQSDMGKLYGYFDKIQRNNPLTSSQIKTMQEAIEAQKKIRGSMFTGMTRNGSQDLANEYGAATRGYKQEVVPYTRNKAITDLQKNEISAKEFAKRLYKSNKFRTEMDEKHPEIAHSEMLHNLINLVPSKKDLIKYGAAGLAGATGAGGYGYYKSGEY